MLLKLSSLLLSHGKIYILKRAKVKVRVVLKKVPLLFISISNREQFPFELSHVPIFNIFLFTLVMLLL